MSKNPHISRGVIRTVFIHKLEENHHMSHEDLLFDERMVIITLNALDLDILGVTEFMNDTTIDGIDRNFIKSYITNSSEDEFIDKLHSLGKTIHNLIPLLSD